jgi:hypothetical protein
MRVLHAYLAINPGLSRGGINSPERLLCDKSLQPNVVCIAGVCVASSFAVKQTVSTKSKHWGPDELQQTEATISHGLERRPAVLEEPVTRDASRQKIPCQIAAQWGA